jgi:hypothetical protein
VLRPGVELSPSYAEWITVGRSACDADDTCVGLSLHSPSVNELADGNTEARVANNVRGGPAYLAQLPCDVAPAFKARSWRVFRGWAEHHLASNAGAYGGDLDLGRAGADWAAGWRRSFLELMLVMDWFVM